MTIDSNQLRDIQNAISDRIYIQIENWNLYLGDAGLSQKLAIECKANLDNGSAVAARKAIEAVQVRLGGGNTQLPLARLISSAQIFELEEILDPYCR
ncbi:DUF3181 family protein [Prochlorococcus marinus]|uniref:DUF3181 domain-containing protein n=1 Tax=Prochlorococcus marinus (strain MIT 9211) TaxID=93059 RepID=A9BDN1_PROM4|nr:DUF3181 family protein [Prochlorococcus marinus]ABX08217.1 conserved hypothetical protein [Prochlorococcus marinus str. MIT 9211]